MIEDWHTSRQYGKTAESLDVQLAEFVRLFRTYGAVEVMHQPSYTAMGPGGEVKSYMCFNDALGWFDSRPRRIPQRVDT